MRAGAILEDTFRGLCEKYTIPIDASTVIDSLNSDLARAGVYDKLIQKRITAIAEISNNADHRHFDNFQDVDVGYMIKWMIRFDADYLK